MSPADAASPETTPAETTPAATTSAGAAPAAPAAQRAKSSGIGDELLLLPLRQRILERDLGVRAIHVHRAGREDVSHRFMDDTVE
ncbi:MAG: serine hydrolase domain-containing protein, partial [Brachybacterium tyrofermentans]